jgi:hypothetical protein
LKTYTDKVKKGGQAKDLPQAYSAIDKAVKKNLIHKNKAARLKSKLAHSISASAQPEKPAKSAKKTTAKASTSKKATAKTA